MQKYTLFFLLCLLPFTSIAQETLKIKGTISGTPGSYYLGVGNVLMWIEASGNTFEMEVKVSEFPVPIDLASVSRRGKINRLCPKVWIAEPEINIDFVVAEKTASHQFNTTIPEQEISEKIEAAKGAAQLALINQYYATIPAAYFLNRFKSELDQKGGQEIINRMRGDNLKSIYHKRLYAWNNAISLEPARKAGTFQHFQLKDADLNDVTVSPKAARTRIIGFMSSGCFYSVASLQKLAEIKKKYGDQFEIVTIWGDGDYDTFKNHRADLKEVISWQNLWDSDGFVDTYFQVNVTPTFLIVDEQGKIIKDVVNAKRLGKAVEKMME